jgi:probable rRNA maturation factor
MTAHADAPARLPAIDVIVDSSLWENEPDAVATVRRAIGAAARDCVGTAGGEVVVLLTGDAAIQALNRRWRGVDAPTNVLSFPAGRTLAGDAGFLGDIAVAYETTAREAQLNSEPVVDHLAHLTVHGFLHLLGYDHQSDDTADIMERLERTILARLGVPDPYVPREPDDLDRHA